MGQTYYQADSFAKVDKSQFTEIERLLEPREEHDAPDEYCEFMKEEGIWTDSFIWPDFDYELTNDGLRMYVEEYGDIENVLEFGRLLVRRKMTDHFEFISVQHGDYLDGEGVIIDKRGERRIQLLQWILDNREGV